MPTRKSKAPGGHLPLTHHEMAKFASGSNYGTAASRLGSDSQAKFGDCCLGLMPAVDPVVTPSGHIYSREAIVSYLLTKTQEIKDAKAKYIAQIHNDQKKESHIKQMTQEQQTKEFLQKDQGSIHLSSQTHKSALQSSLKRKIDMDSKEEATMKLQRSSYWLSESQPQYTNQSKEEEIRSNPPPDRPQSPMSGQPLRLKDLTPITLIRDNGSNNKINDKSNEDDVTTTAAIGSKCLCAVSNKAITTQSVVVIKKTGVVILEDVYNKIVKASMICPIKGKKFKEKDVLYLSKCASGFAASGNVVATIYRPTLT